MPTLQLVHCHFLRSLDAKLIRQKVWGIFLEVMAFELEMIHPRIILSWKDQCTELGTCASDFTGEQGAWRFHKSVEVPA